MEDKRTPFTEREEPTRRIAGWQAPDAVLAGVENRLKQREAYLSLPRSRQELSAALRDARWEIRSVAVEALSATGKQDIVPFIVDALHDQHPLVRASAVRALGKLEEPISVSMLLAAAQDIDWQVREMVMLTLGELEENWAEETLNAALHDPASTVRSAAQHALQCLQQRRAKNHSNGQIPGRALPGEHQHNQYKQRQERKPLLMTNSSQSSLITQNPQHQVPEQVHRRFRSRQLGLLATVAVLAVALMGFTVARWIWNPLFGAPDLYQTINQQQTSMGVTITVTRVYADEGRTIIAYDISAPGTKKDLLVGRFDLSSPVPQRQETLGATACDAPQDGITHCYMLEPAFQVPAGANTLALTWDVTQVIDRSGSPTTRSGLWHFAFTVSFHHENRRDIPNPVDGKAITLP